MRGKRMKAKAGLAIVALIALGACSAQYRSHGFVPPEEELQQIMPGVDTAGSVEELIGAPTTSGVRNNSGFYYVQSQVRHFGWQKPQVIDREIVAITFDDAGVVDNIVTYGLEDGRVVPLQKRVTVTGDGDIGFIRKLFGNIGGFSADQLFGS